MTKSTLLSFIYHFILDKEENCRILRYSSYQPGREPASFRGRHFYACPDASYGGFVPRVEVNAPTAWLVKSNGKAETALIS